MTINEEYRKLLAEKQVDRYSLPHFMLGYIFMLLIYMNMKGTSVMS